jgi:hypothetical protein
MVVCATFLVGQLGPFELTIYSSAAGLVVDQVYPPTWRSPGVGSNGTSNGVNSSSVPAAAADYVASKSKTAKPSIEAD